MPCLKSKKETRNSGIGSLAKGVPTWASHGLLSDHLKFAAASGFVAKTHNFAQHVISGVVKQCFKATLVPHKRAFVASERNRLCLNIGDALGNPHHEKTSPVWAF